MMDSHISKFSLGKIRRLRNIFSKDNKALIVAMDHGMLGNFKGLEHIEIIAEKMINGGADALLLTPAAAKYIVERLRSKISLILSIPYNPRYIELALKLGVEGIKTTYFGPVPLSWEEMHKIWMISQASDDMGIPYMVEIVPCDKEGNILYDVNKIKLAARIGAELGGDIIKTAYVGPPAKYKEVVESTFAPITVMGGPKMETIKDVIVMLKDAVEAGATGGTIGRNIWQHERPERVVKALVSVLHEGKDVEDALKLIQ